MRVLVAAGILLCSSHAYAQRQDSQGSNDQGCAGPTVFSTTACPGGGGDCPVEWVAYDWAPNLPMWKVPFATLTLPPGNYLISAKVSGWLSTWNAVNAGGGWECAVIVGDDPSKGDYMTEGLGLSQGNWELATTFPLKLTARTNLVKFGCRVWGGIITPEEYLRVPIGVKVWGVRLVAERVGSVIEQ